MDERTELDRYLFDLQGYLVIEDVLTVGEVAGLNALVDQHIEPFGRQVLKSLAIWN